MPVATTYNSVGNREQILDLITTLEPEETPLFSTMGTGPDMSAFLMEYQVDDLDNPTFEGFAEGDDVDSYTNQGDGREMLSNRPQKFRQTAFVTKEQEAVTTAGVPSEFAYAKAKAFKQLKRDIEAAIGSDQEAVANTGGNAYKMRALGKWTDATNTNIPSAYRTPAASLGTTSTLTEDGLNTVLDSAYNNTGRSYDFKLYCGSSLRSKITGFTRTDTSGAFVVNQNSTDRTITKSITRYVGDFGTVDIINDMFLGRASGDANTPASKQRGYLLPAGMCMVHYLKNSAPKFTEQTDDGAGRRGYWETILSLSVKSPKGLGKFSG